MKSNLHDPSIPPRFATSSGRACLVHVTDGEHESPVCVCYGSEELDGDAAMAKRIAALLNFAEGVPTEELTGSLLTLAAGATMAAEEIRRLKRAAGVALRHDVARLATLGSVS